MGNLTNEIRLCKTALEHISIIQLTPCGFFEGENIRGIIESFLNSKLPSSEKMLVIFVNGVISYLNDYFSNRLLYLYKQNYHKDDIVTFLRYSNNYVEKVIKYLKIFLHSANIDIPKYVLRQINYKDIENSDFISYLEKYRFIDT